MDSKHRPCRNIYICWIKHNVSKLNKLHTAHSHRCVAPKNFCDISDFRQNIVKTDQRKVDAIIFLETTYLASIISSTICSTRIKIEVNDAKFWAR